MQLLATTTIALYEGDTTDELGDQTDSDAYYASGVPAAIAEREQRVFDPASQTPRVVTTFTGRVRAGVPISRHGRIRDERTGAIYVIENVRQAQNAVLTPDLRLDLRKIN